MTEKIVILKNPNNLLPEPVRARWCVSFLSRLRGFMFRHELAHDEGLVLVESRESRMDSSIHMLFVWTDLAVIWLNAEKEVVDTVLARAWHPFYAPGRAAQYTIEIHPERLNEFNVGDVVEFLDE
ncbi:MAG: DUF192 domain-containing protein [Anaerolineales bacterium]|jgi:uncharacterized membrane protein (UPF0127 family)|nr:DUF192 domain-containing protein [Anaerolineales bacterium]